MPLDDCGLHTMIRLTLSVKSSIKWNEDCRDIVLGDNLPLCTIYNDVHICYEHDQKDPTKK